MRIKHELNVYAVDKNGEETFLDMTVAHETGNDTVDIKIGRGTEVVVYIDQLAEVVSRVQADR